MEVRKQIGTKCSFFDLSEAEVFLWNGCTYIKTSHELDDGTNVVDLESGAYDAIAEETIVMRVDAYLVIS